MKARTSCNIHKAILNHLVPPPTPYALSPRCASTAYAAAAAAPYGGAAAPYGASAPYGAATPYATAVPVATAVPYGAAVPVAAATAVPKYAPVRRDANGYQSCPYGYTLTPSADTCVPPRLTPPRPRPRPCAAPARRPQDPAPDPIPPLLAAGPHPCRVARRAGPFSV